MTVHLLIMFYYFFFFFQAEDGIRDLTVTGVQTCALPILAAATGAARTTDLGVGGMVLGRLGAAGAGWSNTNEGKVIAAAFLDAHNQLVHQVRALQAKELPPPVATKAVQGKG